MFIAPLIFIFPLVTTDDPAITTLPGSVELATLPAMNCLVVSLYPIWKSPSPLTIVIPWVGL